MKALAQRQDSIIFPLGGQFLLDPNEFNGWGTVGLYDTSNTQDLGNVGDTTAIRLASGISFPFDTRLVKFYASHYNSNAGALPWGWRIARQFKEATPTNGTSDRQDFDVISEVALNGGVGPRDYGNTITQRTEMDFANEIVPANHTIILGVEAPTALTAQNYVRILSGFFEFERISQ